MPQERMDLTPEQTLDRARLELNDALVVVARAGAELLDAVEVHHHQKSYAVPADVVDAMRVDVKAWKEKSEAFLAAIHTLSSCEGA